jgi:hypothetical protein
MADPIDLRIQKEINKLAGDTQQYWQGILDSLIQSGAPLEQMNKLLGSVRSSVKDTGEDLIDIKGRFHSITDELKAIVTEEEKAKKSLNDYNNITKKILDNKNGTKKLSSDELKELKKQLNAKSKELQLNNLTADLQHKVIDETIKQNKELDESIKKQQKIENTVRNIGTLATLASQIPIVGKNINVDKAKKAAQDAADAGKGSFGQMSAGIASMGQDIASAFMSPLGILGIIVKLISTFIEFGFKADKEVTQIGKSMAISQESARQMRNHMLDTAMESKNFNDSLFIGLNTLENQLQAQTELADAFGATRGFTDQQIRDQIYLTKQIGMSADETAGLQQLAIANGKTADDIVKATLNQTASLTKQKGIQLDNKKVLAEVAKVSGQLRLQYQNNPKLIAEAVVKANQLGITLEQAAKASKHLLNFEESINDQISAELLTGKQLNFERARLLSLNGDVAGSMEEILNQIGGVEEFSKMNVIQQEAIAKAVGMEVNELSDSLVKRANLNKLGGNLKKQVEEQVELLRKQGRIEEANRLERELGNADEAKASLQRVDAQTKFNTLIEKVKSAIAGMVGGEIEKLINRFIDFLSDPKRVQAFMQELKTGFQTVMDVAKKIASIVEAIYNMGKSIKDIFSLKGLAKIGGGLVGAGLGSFLGPAGTVAGATLGVAGANALVSDGEVSNKGLVVGKYNKGAIQPIAQGLPDDNVIFTTNKPSPVNNQSPSVSIDINSLIKEQQQTNMILNKLLTKEGVIRYDSNIAGKTTNINSYRIQ